MKGLRIMQKNAILVFDLEEIGNIPNKEVQLKVHFHAVGLDFDNPKDRNIALSVMAEFINKNHKEGVRKK